MVLASLFGWNRSKYSKPSYYRNMLISDSHQFIFVHVRKAAGSSLRQSLSTYALNGRNNLWNRIPSRLGIKRDYRKHIFRAHSPLFHAEKHMQQSRFQRYFKFAFIRNPWDRLVSEYEYIRQNKAHARHRHVSAFVRFNDFIHYQYKRTDAYQLPMLTDSSRRICVDFIGRYESLQDDFEKLCNRLNIATTRLPWANPSQRKDYRHYYDTNSVELVYRHWRDEIEQFNYCFD